MDKISPEFIGMLVLGLMQLGQFWFGFMKNRREEEGVKREELNAVETRLDVKMTALEVRLEKKADRAREEQRGDFQEVFKRLNSLESSMASVAKGQEVAEQRLQAFDHKLDVIGSKV